MPDLKPAAAVGAYLLVLLLVFAAALAVGRGVGPIGPAAEPPGQSTSGSDMPGEHP